MGQKTHPLGFRLGISQRHRASWYSNFKNYSNLIHKDYKIRECIANYLLENNIRVTSVIRTQINRNSINDKTVVTLYTVMPSVLLGKTKSLTPLREKLKKCVSEQHEQIFVRLYIVKYPLEHASYIAEKMVDQLEKRTPFRRVIKDILTRIEKEKTQNIKGIKIQVSGRLNGAEIARTEWVKEGQVPLQTLRANFDYSFRTASTIYGILGIKVWVFRNKSLNLPDNI